MTDARPGTAGRPEDHRRQPRRRGRRLLSAVFDAVLAELAERGYGRLTMDAVAGRAQVSKASLYRRWPSKRDLVLAAVQSALPDPADLPDTGSLHGDLSAYFAQVAAHLQGPAGPALRGILGDVLGDPTSAAEIYSAGHRHRTAQQLRVLLQRAVDRDELSAGHLNTITARQLEAGPAILRHHYLWEGRLSDQLSQQIVDEVVWPLLFRDAGSSPGEDVSS